MPIGKRYTEDEMLVGEGVITSFSVVVGRGAAISGSGFIDGDHGKIRVNFANLFFGHVRPRNVDGFDTYEGVRVKYVALPADPNNGFVHVKAIRVEALGNNESDRRGNGGGRRERPSKIGDPRYAEGRD